MCLSQKPGVRAHQIAMEVALSLFRRSRAAYAVENMPGYSHIPLLLAFLRPRLFRMLNACGCLYWHYHALNPMSLGRECQRSGSAIAALHLLQSSPADQFFPCLAQLFQVSSRPGLRVLAVGSISFPPLPLPPSLSFCSLSLSHSLDHSLCVSVRACGSSTETSSFKR